MKNREELGTVIARFANEIYEVDTASASDVAFKGTVDYNTVSDWAKSSLIWTSDNGILSGLKYSDGLHLLPQETATRSQTSKILTESIKKFLF